MKIFRYLLIVMLLAFPFTKASSQLIITDINSEVMKVKVGEEYFSFKPGMSIQEIVAQANSKRIKYKTCKDGKSIVIHIVLDKKNPKIYESITISEKYIVYINYFITKDYLDFYTIFEEKGAVFQRLPSSENLSSEFKNNMYNDVFVCRRKFNKYVQLILTKTFYKEVLTFDLPKSKK